MKFILVYLWVLLVLGIGFIIAIVLNDYLVYRNLQKKLKRERSKVTTS